MRIRDIEIQNFRSISKVSMEGLDGLTILIGPNGSGKSNILEALYVFFSQLDPAPQRNLGAITDYLWFDRDSSKPISISATLQVDDNELTELIPESLLSLIMKKGSTNIVKISREISGPAQSASTVYKRVEANDVVVVTDGTLAVVAEKLPAEPPVQSSEVLARILQNLSRSLQSAYILLPAARNFMSVPSFGQRTSMIQPELLSQLTQMGSSLDIPHEQRWRKIEDYILGAEPSIQDVRVLGGQITLREKKVDKGFPISLFGGGDQELFALMHSLTAEFKIFGIEEPETHLHPQLARRLFEIFKELADSKQLLIATHSTVFIDLAEPQNTWIVTKTGKETTVSRLAQPEDLQRLMYELGIRPSDVFFPNGIVFVEGYTEAAVLPIMAEKLGVSFKEHSINVIPIRGKGSGKYHLSVWVDAVNKSNLRHFMILDKDAEEEAKKLRQFLVRDQNLFILKKGPIESYYPAQRVSEALTELYWIEVSKDEKARLDAGSRAAEIEKILQERKVEVAGWKVIVGQHVAKNMDRPEIDEEIVRIIERIRSNLPAS